MNHWQDITVICLVLAAGAYLLRLLWCRLAGKAAGCADACEGCPAEAGSDPCSRCGIEIHQAAGSGPEEEPVAGPGRRDENGQ